MSYKGKHSENKGKHPLFFKSLFLAFNAILLILVGYFSAGFFSGGL